MDGYIKLHRCLLDNPFVCKDSDYLSVWVYLLLNATHTSMDALFAGKKITLNPGQLITGRISISGKLNISDSKVQRILKTFEIEQQIEQQTCNKNRLITLINWDKYQITEQQNEQQLNNKRTTTEQQLNTNKNVKKERMKEKLHNTAAQQKKVDVLEFFEVVWKLYPRRLGKSSVSFSQKQKLYDIGLEEMERAIKRYCDDNKGIDQKFLKYGSSFFNSGYEDYLDANYTQQQVQVAKPQQDKNKFHNFEQRDTNYDAMALERLQERLKGGEADERVDDK